MLEDPTIPLEELMPGTAQTVLIVAMALAAAASLVYATRESRRRRDLVPLFLVLGAAISIYYEALGDALVKVYYTERGQETWIHSFGRDIPAFIGLLYFWYLPAGAYVLLRRAKRGITARQWWTSWLGFLAFAIVFEMLVLTVGGTTWIYHGPQAFMVLDVPIGTPFTYVSFDVAIAAGVCALAHFLPRRRQWLIVPAVPMLMAASHAATSLPLAIALYGSDDESVIAIGAVGSMAFAIVLSHLLSLAFRKPWPERPETSARAQRTLDHREPPTDVIGAVRSPGGVAARTGSAFSELLEDRKCVSGSLSRGEPGRG